MLKKLLLFVLCLYFLQVFVLAEPNAESKRKQMEKYEKMLKWQKEINEASKIKVYGSIIDENGNPLDLVELKCSFSRSKGWKNERLTVKNLSKSKFSIVKSGYTGVTVYFRKKGYFAETRFYGTTHRSQYLDKHTFLKEDEKIILRKRGEFAKLKRVKKLLEVNFKNQEKSIIKLSDLSYQTLPATGNHDIKKYICVDFKKNANGEILMFKNEKGMYIPRILFVRFISDDKSDGFIIEKDIKDISYLTEAPMSQYTQKDIDIPYNSKDIYFYYKNGKYFGKGVFQAPGFRFGKGSIWIKLMQNEYKVDKSRKTLHEDESNEMRNLRSGKY